MKKKTSPWVRVIILIVSLIIISFLAYQLTGAIIPEEPQESMIFQTALLLIVLGSALIETHFTKPADSLVNSLTGIITIITVYRIAPSVLWWVVFSFSLFVLILATANVTVSSEKSIIGWQKKVAEITYRPAVYFGSARLYFSVLFLFGVFTYYGVQSPESVVLLLFWGLFIVIWPLGLPEFLSGLRMKPNSISPIGKVIRSEWPNIIRVGIDQETIWEHNSIKLLQQVDKTQCLVVPLYRQFQGDQIIGTGLIRKVEGLNIKNLEDCCIYEILEHNDLPNEVIAEVFGGEQSSRLIGFVIEESKIAEINFETWAINSCYEGKLVWCKIGKDRVYYQITDGTNREETFQTNRQGFQVAEAAQLGVFNNIDGFVKYRWLPHMNTPIFSVSEEFGREIKPKDSKDFHFGVLPETELNIYGPLNQNMEYHTALLGVTGSGKTELGYDIIRNATEQGIKVICIDLTAKYEDRLTDLNPMNLSISAESLIELQNSLLDVETGTYGAGEEKKALKKVDIIIRTNITESLTNFLKSKDDASKVGVIDLVDISNTKVTIYLTEMYLTALLHFARDNSKECPRTLIVVEEAHTVMPEPTTMGLGDYNSRGIVSKIAQIALQGRKFGVGLLILAQRTANVTKTVLTQCNTIISFTTYDETSINFLSNLFGRTYAQLLPNLSTLQVVAYGKGIRSQRPIIIEIPFDESKVNI